MSDWKMRPARDLGLTTAERLRSHGREPGLTGLMLQGAWRQVVGLYLGLGHRLRVTGRENLPDSAPFVMVGNHSSHLDALTLAAALPSHLARRAYALAAADTFFGSTASAAFAAYAVNALPVWRRQAGQRGLGTLRARLQEDGVVLLLFPEGTRSRDGRLGAFQAGMGVLVADTAVPVVPCYLEGAFEAWSPQQRWPRLGKRLTLRIGRPLTFQDTTNDKSGWIAVAAASEAAVRTLATE